MSPYWKVRRKLKNYLNPTKIKQESRGIIIIETNQYVSKSYIQALFPGSLVKKEKTEPGEEHKYTIFLK